MLVIENDQLRVEILDPQKDRDKLGSRYCSGGQIFQVYDKEKGALLAGPTYPESYNSFDSQGLPDAFNAYPGLDEAAIGDLVMAIGVGLVRYAQPVQSLFARDNSEVVEPLDWKIQKADNALGFYAIHDYKDHAYALTREIILEGRQLVVVNVLENCSKVTLPLSWFAHPFFPPTADGVVGEIPASYEENQFYSTAADGRIKIAPPADQTVPLNVGAVAEDEEDTTLRIAHYLLGEIEIDCGFPVAKIPLWCNANSFSPEPYLLDELEPNENAQWEISYSF